MLPQSRSRWEYLPLITQQLRLRNVRKIMAYNLSSNNADLRRLVKSYYYTLHLSPTSEPIYTSEKITRPNPKWEEVLFKNAVGSSTGVIVRIWECGEEGDIIITSWGVYFSGLVFVGADLPKNDVEYFAKNAILFGMDGGYFTSGDFLTKDEPTEAKIAVLKLDENDITKSYDIEALCRLHYTQRSIKKLSEEGKGLHDKILAGEYENDAWRTRENSPFLRKLMNQCKPSTATRREITNCLKQAETRRFELELLREEKARLENRVKEMTMRKNILLQENCERERNLIKRLDSLYKDKQGLKHLTQKYAEDYREEAACQEQLKLRLSELLSEIRYIYPIDKAEGRYFVHGIYLPDADRLNDRDDLELSVALGFVAHLVLTMSRIIDIPLRYAILHYASESKIIDHILPELQENDRTFCLFAKSKDKMRFNYAVYLLNKDIAQLRWHRGLLTDGLSLKCTLKNLAEIMEDLKAKIKFESPKEDCVSAIEKGKLMVPEDNSSHSTDDQDHTDYVKKMKKRPVSEDKGGDVNSAESSKD